MPDITVRRASMEDAAGIVRLFLEHMAHDTGLAIPDPDPECVQATVERCIYRGVTAIAVRNGEIVGVLQCDASRPWWSKKWILIDAGFYVRQDARRSTAARDMVKLVRDFARDKSAPLCISLFTGTDSTRKGRFIERLGLKAVGGTYTEGF